MQCNKKFLDILLSSFKYIVDWGLFVRSYSTCELTSKGQPRSQTLSPLQICFGAKIMTSQAVQRPCCPSPRLAVYGLSSSPKCYCALFQCSERDTSILLLSPIAHGQYFTPIPARHFVCMFIVLKMKWLIISERSKQINGLFKIDKYSLCSIGTSAFLRIPLKTLHQIKKIVTFFQPFRFLFSQFIITSSSFTQLSRLLQKEGMKSQTMAGKIINP